MGTDASTETDAGQSAATDAGATAPDAGTLPSDGGAISPIDASVAPDGGVVEEPCEENEHVSAHRCVPCAPGRTNAPGDRPAGPDTTCDRHLCAPNHHVADHVCTPCPSGLTRPGGDDPAGRDTECSSDPCAAVGVRCDDFAEAYIKAFNVDDTDQFGTSVAVDGDTLVVGAPLEASNGEPGDNSIARSGAVYVYRRMGTAWTREAFLKAPNVGEDDAFGTSVALSGNTLVVGAPREDSQATGVGGDDADNSARDAGAAYVFERSGGRWVFEGYLKPSHTDAYDNFGASVSVDGDTIVVSASGDDSNATRVNGNAADNSASSSGAAYVFARSPSGWSQQAYLKAHNGEADDTFGFVVSVDGDTIAVGAFTEGSDATGIDGDGSNNRAPTSGAAYVFVRRAETWSQEAYIKASTVNPNDLFGYSIALSGDTLAVGAQAEAGGDGGVDGDESDNSAPASGAVFVFARTGTTWRQQGYIKASHPDIGDLYATTVALDGDHLAVGAIAEDGAGPDLLGDPADNSAQASGAVYLYQRTGDRWHPQAYIKAPICDTSDFLGSAVSLHDGTLAMGARNEASGDPGVDADLMDNSSPNSGAVYVRRYAPHSVD